MRDSLLKVDLDFSLLEDEMRVNTFGGAVALKGQRISRVNNNISNQFTFSA